jgi:ATP-binding cassette, subfamily B, bacterial
MSLRFFTNTKVGELMSRLNNDVVGAQNADQQHHRQHHHQYHPGHRGGLVMLTLEWRLTLMAVTILPFFFWWRA